MGSVLSIPTALSVALIAGGIFYGFLQKRPPPPDWASPSNRAVLPGEVVVQTTGEGKSKKKKKAAVKGAAQPATQPEVEPTVVSFPAVVPGGFEQPQPAEPAATASKPKKKKKAKKTTGGVPSVPLDAQSDSSATAPESSSTPVPRPAAKRKSTPVIDTDGPWTRVESRKRTGQPEASAQSSSVAPASDAGVTTSVTDTSSPVTERTEDEQVLGQGDNRRTLAERLLPKPRKTRVEDMLETPDAPAIARVMRIHPRADEQPAAGFSWADYEDVESGVTADDADGEDDGGWIVKASRPRTTSTKPSQPVQTATETMTKKQRQNQKRKELEKAEKAAARAEQDVALAKHKRELEKVRMQEQFSKGKKAGGGMRATVDEKGHMVFE